MFTRVTPLLLALALSLPAATAIADPSAIFKVPIRDQDATKSQRFAINADMGRAWVEIEVYYSESDSSEVYRVQVPGLEYNKAQHQVLFSHEGQSVTCANVRTQGQWIFKRQHLEPTGHCELSRKYVKVPVDNGFAVDVIEHFEVQFKPRNATLTPTSRTAKTS